MAAEALEILIIVYKGEPQDWQRHRQASIIVRASNNKSIALRLSGLSSKYDIEINTSPEAPSHTSIAGTINVGRMKAGVTTDEIQEFASQQNPDNSDPSYSSQNWVGDVLRAMQVEKSWLSEAQIDHGLDKMVDLILDAPESDTR